MELSTGLAITALLAAVYGVGFALVPKTATGPVFQRVYVMGGGLFILACAIVLVIVPWIGERS